MGSYEPSAWTSDPSSASYFTSTADGTSVVSYGNAAHASPAVYGAAAQAGVPQYSALQNAAGFAGLSAESALVDTRTASLHPSLAQHTAVVPTTASTLIPTANMPALAAGQYAQAALSGGAVVLLYPVAVTGGSGLVPGVPARELGGSSSTATGATSRSDMHAAGFTGNSYLSAANPYVSARGAVAEHATGTQQLQPASVQTPLFVDASGRIVQTVDYSSLQRAGASGIYQSTDLMRPMAASSLHSGNVQALTVQQAHPYGGVRMVHGLDAGIAVDGGALRAVSSVTYGGYSMGMQPRPSKEWPRRGRPRGAKDKNPRKRRAPKSDSGGASKKTKDSEPDPEQEPRLPSQSPTGATLSPVDDGGDD